MHARRRPAARAPGRAGATRAFGPDLVHTHLVHADVYGAIAAARARAVLVSTKHNDDPFRSGKGRYLERLLTRRRRSSSASPRRSRASTATSWDFPAPKLRVVHYGLDAPPEPWGPPGGPGAARRHSRARRRLAASSARRAWTSRSTRSRRYGNGILLRSSSCSARDRFEASSPSGLRGRGLADAVNFPGRVGDVAWWLRRADVVVHPARWEGFGLALLEAMLCARPVVATAVSSIPEIVADGETGLLVPPEDPAALAEAVTVLLDDPARAAGDGRAPAESVHAPSSRSRVWPNERRRPTRRR